MIAILGAGISGLSLAYYLQKQGKEVVVLEKEKIAGGKIQSFKEDGFTGELGPNTVLLNNSGIIDLINEIGLKDKLIFADPENISKRFILFNGKLEPVPSGIFSALRSPLLSFSTIGKIISDIRGKNGNSNKESLANMVKRHFGTEAYENFVVPMLTGIYAGDPQKMDADFVLPFLKKADREYGSIIKGMMLKEKANLPKQKIFTFEKGLQQLPSTLAKKLGKNNLQLNSKIQSINKEAGKYRIEFNISGKSGKIYADQVVSSLPASALEKIDSSFLKGISKDLLKIPYVPVVMLHFAYPKSGIGFQEKAFGLLSRPEENVPFLGVLFNSRFFPHTAAKDKELITVICGGGFNPEITKLKDGEIFEKVESAIEKILRVTSKPIFKKISRWENAIPQYYLGHEEILKNFRDFEAEHPGFYFGGNYLHGISVSDCIANAEKLADKINQV